VGLRKHDKLDKHVTSPGWYVIVNLLVHKLQSCCS
jgi:hypothetical protein